MLLSLIIVSCGAFLTILLIDLGQTIKCKTHIGQLKNKDWHTEDTDKMFYQIEEDKKNETDS